jgi:hypothetical protein
MLSTVMKCQYCKATIMSLQAILNVELKLLLFTAWIF